MASERAPAISVDRLMTELQDDVRRARRKRLLARGGAAEYRDPEIYEHVDVVLRRALEGRDHIVGVELLAVVELHALPDREDVGLAVLGNLHAFRELGNRLRVLVAGIERLVDV